MIQLGRGEISVYLRRSGSRSSGGWRSGRRRAGAQRTIASGLLRGRPRTGNRWTHEQGCDRRG
eukprot:44242-Pleurochrysis_carterae.AAC.1